MQANASASNPLQPQNAVVRQHRPATYKKVLDQRKRPIRGLWHRNGRYFAQVTIEDAHSGLKQVKDAKRESTLETEQHAINHWIEHLGHVRLDRINRALVNSYIAKRQGDGMADNITVSSGRII